MIIFVLESRWDGAVKAFKNFEDAMEYRKKISGGLLMHVRKIELD